MASLFPNGFPDPAAWRSAYWREHPFRTIDLYTATERTPDGGALAFRAFSTPQELASPEAGGVRIRVDTIPASDTAYLIDVCVADWDDQWARTFCAEFARHPAVRAPFDAARARGHTTVPVALPGGTVPIDRDLAKAILTLNSRGVLTDSCCQGGGWSRNNPAYIDLKPGSAFPTELSETWRRAGYWVADDGSSVQTTARYGLADIASVRFRQSLEDWMGGRLDLSGNAYRVTEPRPLSRPQLAVSDDPTDPPPFKPKTPSLRLPF